VSDDVEIVTTSPVEVLDGFETVLAMTCTLLLAAIVPQLPPTVSVTVAPPLLATALSTPHSVAVVVSSIVYVEFELKSVPDAAVITIVPASGASAPVDEVVNEKA
jgi:hypothetical protein